MLLAEGCPPAADRRRHRQALGRLGEDGPRAGRCRPARARRARPRRRRGPGRGGPGGARRRAPTGPDGRPVARRGARPGCAVLAPQARVDARPAQEGPGPRAAPPADGTRRLLRYEQGRVLGIFPVDRWPAADSAHEEIVRRALHDVLVTGRLATPTEAGLVTILLAVDRLHRVVPSTGLSRRDLRSRAKVVADGHFAGEAVRKAIEAINAAIVSATVVTAVVAGGSS